MRSCDRAGGLNTRRQRTGETARLRLRGSFSEELRERGEGILRRSASPPQPASQRTTRLWTRIEAARQLPPLSYIRSRPRGRPVPPKRRKERAAQEAEGRRRLEMRHLVINYFLPDVKTHSCVVRLAPVSHSDDEGPLCSKSSRPPGSARRHDVYKPPNRANAKAGHSRRLIRLHAVLGTDTSRQIRCNGFRFTQLHRLQQPLATADTAPAVRTWKRSAGQNDHRPLATASVK